MVPDRTIAKSRAMRIGRKVIAYVPNSEQDLLTYYRAGEIVGIQTKNGMQQFKVSTDDGYSGYCYLSELRIMDLLPDTTYNEPSIIDDAAHILEQITELAKKEAADKEKAQWDSVAMEMPFAGFSFNDSESVSVVEEESTSHQPVLEESESSEDFGMGLFD
eukprot:TRINITY_DN7117_c0_g1_i1.p2 TRINITY_DN7117_c0_g1~~TRINITY_DN7117_c0_g1_i1.p2  ORF type:complete len:161 (+),score=63.95 TRINITY_DN7117_c0_g1_i1:367-849(+)